MNLMWNRFLLPFLFLLFILSLTTIGSGEEKILIAYKETYLIKNMDIAKMLHNFLLHFDLPIDEIKFPDLDISSLNEYRYIFILTTNTIPEDMLKKLSTLKNSKICIMGKVTNLRYFPYLNEKKGFTKITYKGIDYFLSPNTLIYSYSVKSKKDTKTIAKVTDGKNILPFLFKKENIYLIGGFPLWDEPSYFLANFLYNFLDVSYIKKKPKILLIIQDINPYTKPENLKNTVKVLEREKIPFVISYYPIHFDVYRKRFTTIREMKALSFFLKVLAQRDINFILSGVLKRYYRENIEKDAEFWDIKNDAPIPDFPEYFKKRIYAGFTASKEIGVFPVGFMPPEFAFPPKYLNLVGKYFDYYIGTIQLSNYTYKATQSLPYVIKDSKNDLYFITPNLGYVKKDNPSLSISTIIEKAEKLKYVKNAFGVVYFHPFIDKKYLKELINGLQNIGYEFSNLPYLKENSEKIKNIKYLKGIKFSGLKLKEEKEKIKKIGRKMGMLLFVLSLFFVILGITVYMFTTRKKYKELFKIILILVGISLIFSTNAYSKKAVVIGERKSDVIMLTNLLGHFKLDVSTYLDKNFNKNDVENADILFFISNNDHKISEEILEIFKHRKKENCFIGIDPELIINAGNYPIEYMGLTKDFPYLIYRDTEIFNEWEMYSPIIKLKEGKAYGYLSNLKERIPLFIKTRNLWLVLGDPFYSYTGMAFSDFLHDIIGEDHKGIPKMLVRIEDINPDYPLKVLKKTTNYLIKNYIPFAMAFYPIYMNFDLKESVTLSRKPKMISYLREIDKHMGRIIMHGITHQYSKHEISGEGSEFWDMIHNKPIPNFKEYFRRRISYGISVFKKLNLPFYAFEPPHYNLSIEGELELKKYIPIYVGQVMVDDPESTQEFYYPIYKSYAGLYIIPENLGYVEKEDPKESIERILYKAKIIKKIIRDPFASFFFHPFMGVDYLKPIIKGLDEMGYYFVDLKREVPPLILPKVEEVKVEDLNLPFYYKERKGFRLSTKAFTIIAFLASILLAFLYNLRRRKKY